MKFLQLSSCALTLFILSACATSPDNRIASGWEVDGGVLRLGGRAVLGGLPEEINLTPDNHGGPGVFLTLRTGESESGYFRWTGIRLADLERFTALHRELPWWMVPAHGLAEKDIPPETQCLLWKRSDGQVGLLLPLLDRGYRMNAGGAPDGLTITADNNLPDGNSGLELRAAYVAVGDDPYALLAESFAATVKTMGIGRLRRDKATPRWTDRLGWCTWNSFYHAVNHRKVLDGLESFASGGFRPAWLILDDGWQEAREYGFLHEQTWLTGLGANPEKFPGGLAETVRLARENHGVEDFLVWQTFQGYWRGIDPALAVSGGFSAYSATGRSNRPLNDRTAEWVPLLFNVPDTVSIVGFFDAYNSRLAGQGVTGVKVDNQSHLEFMTWGMGALTDVMGAYKRALERSVDRHFGEGSLINCMGLGADALFQAGTSTVTRNSNDFFPDLPASHCLHLVTNAYNSLMTGQLVLPDWDMFQSGHEWGAYHASARAVSGGPVYLSDRPGEQDFSLIAGVAYPDGRVLRCPEPALPTPDILFRDPLSEDVLLKVFNRNLPGTWVLGVWNCRWDSLRTITVSDTLSVSLIPGAAPDRRYAVRAFNTGRLELRPHPECWLLSLDSRGWEVYTVAEVEREVAPLGNLGMFNSAGVFESFGWSGSGTYEARVRAGGEIGFYCGKTPAVVEVSGVEQGFDYDPSNGLLRVDTPGTSPAVITLIFR